MRSKYSTSNTTIMILTNANLFSIFVINQVCNIHTTDAISIPSKTICAFQSQTLLNISPQFSVNDVTELSTVKEVHGPEDPSSLEIFHCIFKWQKPQLLTYKMLFLFQEKHTCTVEKTASFHKTNGYSVCS